jgi:hypothetical protein
LRRNLASSTERSKELAEVTTAHDVALDRSHLGLTESVTPGFFLLAFKYYLRTDKHLVVDRDFAESLPRRLARFILQWFALEETVFIIKWHHRALYRGTEREFERHPVASPRPYFWFAITQKAGAGGGTQIPEHPFAINDLCIGVANIPAALGHNL